MDSLLHVAIVLMTFFTLALGADWIVDAAARIAKRMGISELVIGLTIVAFGTSAPEFGVTIMAAFRGAADISVGNIIGSNIFNLGFILGGTAMVTQLHTSAKVGKRDILILLLGTILLSVFILDDYILNRFEGSVLFIALIGYIIYLYVHKDPFETEIPAGDFRWLHGLKLIAGLAVLLISTHFLIDSATALARSFGISEWVIGVTIIAAGTSAPAFATAILAAVRGHHGISIGSLIGSDIFNIFGVLGLAGMLQNLHVSPDSMFSILFLIGMVVVVGGLIKFNKEQILSWQKGMVLVGLGLLRWLISFNVH